MVLKKIMNSTENLTKRHWNYYLLILLTLRFYFPYLSLLAQPVTIFVYGPARYLHYYFR
jgi:hypothetical protein